MFSIIYEPITAKHGGSVGGLDGFCALRPKGRRFESHSGRHVGTLSKFLAHDAAIPLHRRHLGVWVHFWAMHA